MNKAAGELAFAPFFPEKKDFLRHLAGIYWGNDADRVAEAWTHFTDGYRNFPIGVDFEWFSTMQDSPCAPYHLEPIDMPLPSTWTLDEMVGADRVCDCIFDSHTLDEVITLTSILSDKWNAGYKILSEIDDFSTENRREQRVVAEAANYIFRSGLNTFKFYDLRNKLALGKGNGNEILEEMKKIVYEEIEISRKLIPITESDNRIGYHSEAHGYKIFPEKLSWRISEMEKLLETEFPKVQNRLRNGEIPLPFYYGMEDGARVYRISESDINKASWMSFVDEDGKETDKTQIRVAKTENEYIITIALTGKGDNVKIDPEFKIFHRKSPIFLGNGKLEIQENPCYSLFGERLEKRRAAVKLKYSEDETHEYYEMTLDMSALDMENGDPFRLMIKRSGSRADAFAPDDRIFTRLITGSFSTDAFGFFIP